ncbi:MAG: hypothetical protein ACLFWD_13350 [Anaerolineales bacterium]
MTAKTETRMGLPTVRLEHRPGGVAVLWLDVEGESVNKIRPEMAQDLEAIPSKL